MTLNNVNLRVRITNTPRQSLAMVLTLLRGAIAAWICGGNHQFDLTLPSGSMTVENP